MDALIGMIIGIICGVQLGVILASYIYDRIRGEEGE